MDGHRHNLLFLVHVALIRCDGCSKPYCNVSCHVTFALPKTPSNYHCVELSCGDLDPVWIVTECHVDCVKRHHGCRNQAKNLLQDGSTPHKFKAGPYRRLSCEIFRDVASRQLVDKQFPRLEQFCGVCQGWTFAVCIHRSLTTDR